MKKSFRILALTMVLAIILTACGGANQGSTAQSEATTPESTTSTEAKTDSTATEATGDYSDEITIVWYPNESATDFEASRDAIGKHIEEATGKTVKHQLTTDYAIAIEAIANGQANLAFMGAQGYVEANAKNDKVQPLVVTSGESGTLDDAIYYSWLGVKKGNESQYQNDAGDYTIDNIKGKRMSFVSNSSTSGFVIPTSTIISHFPDEHLTQELLMEGGDGKFFSEVLFGGSHQGSAVNVLADNADIGAFCDTCVSNYVELASGELNKKGSVVRVRDDAADPFTPYVGQELFIIESTPVLNAPMAVNTEVTSPEDVKAILAAFTSDELNNDPLIWREEGSDTVTMYERKGNMKFIGVEDSWFDPIRALGENK